MATMTIRTTVAFDPATVARWERLSKRWGTNKSETLRRALEAAEQKTESAVPAASCPSEEQVAAMSAEDALDWLCGHTLVSPAEGKQWREQMKQTRADFAARP
jgi:hypothetical protein